MADMTDLAAGGTDAAAGAPADKALGAEPPETEAEVLVTISKAPDGTFLVQAGDEPEGDEPAAEGAPDAAAEAPPPAAEPVPCKTIGETLKAALDILQGESGGGEANEEEDFQSGYGEDKAPKIAQKY